MFSTVQQKVSGLHIENPHVDSCHSEDKKKIAQGVDLSQLRSNAGWNEDGEESQGD